MLRGRRYARAGAATPALRRWIRPGARGFPAVTAQPYYQPAHAVISCHAATPHRAALRAGRRGGEPVGEGAGTAACGPTAAAGVDRPGWLGPGRVEPDGD